MAALNLMRTCNCTTVSYTHLDVYKRQVYVLNIDKKKNMLFCKAQTIFFKAVGECYNETLLSMFIVLTGIRIISVICYNCTFRRVQIRFYIASKTSISLIHKVFVESYTRNDTLQKTLQWDRQTHELLQLRTTDIRLYPRPETLCPWR